VDFRALSTQNLITGGDGAKTVAGMAWTLNNSASATSVNITAGTGLVIVCNTTNSLKSGTTNNAPEMRILLNTAFSFYNFKRFLVGSQIVRVWARVLLTNADANFENGFLVIEDAATPTNQWFGTGKGFNTANNFTFFANDSPAPAGTPVANTIDQSTAAFTDDVLGLTYEGPDCAQGWSAVYDTLGDRLPEESNSQRFSYSANIATPLMRTTVLPRVCLGAETGNATGSLTVTFTHFRVDVLEVQGPG
jgi:hypothetical protein